MRVDRFYVDPAEVELKHDFWLHDQRLVDKWRQELHLEANAEVVLFDGVREDRLYKIVELNEREAHLELVTEYSRKLPSREVYVLFALLNKDATERLLQKGTELGISHFVPLLTDQSQATTFDIERAKQLVTEAAEQSERSDIPAVREPIVVETAITELKDKVQLVVGELTNEPSGTVPGEGPVGVLLAPAGGWSEAERAQFAAAGLQQLPLHNDGTHSPEAPCLAAAAALLTLLV